MAAPGTVTHVLEVAAQLRAATAAHAAALADQVATVTVPSDSSPNAAATG